MEMKIARVAVLAALSLGLAAQPASAHDASGMLCTMRGAAYGDAMGYTGPSFSYPNSGDNLVAGDSFRVHTYGVNADGRTWFYGHAGRTYPRDIWVTGWAIYCPSLGT